MSPSCTDNPGVRVASGCPGLCPLPPVSPLRVLASTKVGLWVGRWESSGHRGSLWCLYIPLASLVMGWMGLGEASV